MYEQARADLLRLVVVVGGSEGSLPTFGEPKDRDDETVLSLDGTTWRLEFFERGLPRLLVASSSFEDMAFEILRSLTQGIATTWELKHRVLRKDTRRAWFALQAQLFERLGEPFVTRIREAQATILQQHPFDDAIDDRLERMRTYEAQGCSKSDAYRRALSDFPAPPPGGLP